MVSKASVEDNLAAAGRLAERAAEDGAKLLVLPEYFALMAMSSADLIAAGETEGAGPIQDWLADVAARLGVWIVGGTMPIRADGAHVYGTALVYDASGTRAARYDKIHLFDASAGETHRESRFLAPGREPVTIETPFGRLGVAVCYDLRFPELFRRLIDAGAEIIAVTAAFTQATGAAHWSILTRARAIENLCYVVAAAQGGRHRNGRVTFGHSMIVDPWGEVLNEAAQGSAVVAADLDAARLATCRKQLPALEHRRL
jgi:nitrilase